jgi:hypothetical protein
MRIGGGLALRLAGGFWQEYSIAAGNGGPLRNDSGVSARLPIGKAGGNNGARDLTGGLGCVGTGMANLLFGCR